MLSFLLLGAELRHASDAPINHMTLPSAEAHVKLSDVLEIHCNEIIYIQFQSGTATNACTLRLALFLPSQLTWKAW